MTAHGHPRTEFRHAVTMGNAALAISTYHELARPNLADKLALCLALRVDARYPRAAVRFAVAYLDRHRETGLDEVRTLVDYLARIGAGNLESARDLSAWLLHEGERDAAGVALRVADGWRPGRPPPRSGRGSAGDA
jgi:hypothetical protein